MVRYNWTQLNRITDLSHLGLNDVKGDSYNSVIQSCVQRVALFYLLTLIQYEKEIKTSRFIYPKFCERTKGLLLRHDKGNESYAKS